MSEENESELLVEFSEYELRAQNFKTTVELLGQKHGIKTEAKILTQDEEPKGFSEVEVTITDYSEREIQIIRIPIGIAAILTRGRRISRNEITPFFDNFGLLSNRLLVLYEF